MRTFREYFDQKARDGMWKNAYDRECNVCKKTARIFEKIEEGKKSLQAIADNLDIEMDKLVAQRNADDCDPELVTRLCRLVGERPPQTCPRMKK